MCRLILSDELPAKNQACITAGKLPIQKLQFEGQDDATTALLNGHADAITADSSVTGYIIKTNAGQVEARPLFETALWGWAVDNGSSLGPRRPGGCPMLHRLRPLHRHPDQVGVEMGALTESRINDATY